MNLVHSPGLFSRRVHGSEPDQLLPCVFSRTRQQCEPPFGTLENILYSVVVHVNNPNTQQKK